MAPSPRVKAVWPDSVVRVCPATVTTVREVGCASRGVCVVPSTTRKEAELPSESTVPDIVTAEPPAKRVTLGSPAVAEELSAVVVWPAAVGTGLLGWAALGPCANAAGLCVLPSTTRYEADVLSEGSVPGSVMAGPPGESMTPEPAAPPDDESATGVVLAIVEVDGEVVGTAI